MPRIKTLSVRSFRGITEAELPFEGRSLVLLGENGTGKSSFVDALEFFFQGRVKHLEGTQRISTTQHAPHILGSRSAVLVKLEFDKPASTVSRTFVGVSRAVPELHAYMNLGASSTFILRRKNILDFILAQPSSRYEQLAAIIGVDDLDKAERALMQARDDLLARNEATEQQMRSEIDKLKQLLEVPVVTDEQILTALNQKLQSLRQPPLSSWEEIESRKVAAISRSRSPEDIRKVIKVQELLSLIQASRQAPLIPEGYHEFHVRVSELQRDHEQRRLLMFQDLLASSRRLMADLGLDYCPVCLRPIDKEDLLASLDKRVRETEELAHKAAEIRQLGARLANQIQARRSQLEKLALGASELALSVEQGPLQQCLALLDQMLATLQADPWNTHLTPRAELCQSPAVRALECNLEVLSKKAEAEQGWLEPTEQDKLTYGIVELLSKTAESRQLLRDLQIQCAIKAATYQEMAAVYDCFVTAKQQEVQSIYRALESDIQRFFGLLHKGEGYRTVKLEIKKDRRASTDIRMDFYDREQEDPRAFNSEGHLDSLGLCVFLAFVKHFNSGFPLMVLDDVVSSIDSGHRRHICDLLLQEFGDYQLLITTHDYIWFEELCAHQRANKAQEHFTNLQIVDWSLDGGPRLSKYRPRWERISEKLTNGDRDGAAADVRKELEGFLYEMCVRTETPVVLRRDGRYVVSELLAPFIKRIGKLIPDVYGNSLAVFQALDEAGIFGNLLVHSNLLAGNATLDEVREFAAAVGNLETLFTCGEGHLAEYHRAARVMKCRCGAINWPTKE